MNVKGETSGTCYDTAEVKEERQDTPEQPVSSNSSLCDESHLLQMITIMQLPKADELMTFNGDPLKFWMFMRSFDSSIRNASIDHSAKLNRRFQYCKGEALKVIKCCAAMQFSERYAKARALLKERFGNDYRISEMWLRKVTKGPVIRNNKGHRLQELADDLRGCKEILEAVNKLEEIDTRRSIVKIVERLPQFLQGRWRKLVVKTLKATGRHPSIANLMRFVSEVAREATDPVFGVSEFKPKEFSGRGFRKPERDKGANFGLQAEEQQRNQPQKGNSNDAKGSDTKTKRFHCRLCKGDHRWNACSQFKALSSGEKLGFAWGKKLCFCCFHVRHVASQCEVGVVCGVDGCTAKHSKLLHQSLERSSKRPSDEKPPKPDPKPGNQQVEGHSNACSSLKPERSKMALPIVPVRARAKGETDYYHSHAWLDSGSTETFCSEALLERLNVKGKQVTLSLTTVNSSESNDVGLVALEVTAAKSVAGRTGVIHLPKVYSLSNLPSLLNCMTLPSKIRKWPHLKDLRLPQVDKSGVIILIGQDIPEALWPLELRKGKGQPYAARTRLGWMLNDPLESESLAEEPAFSNFARANSRWKTRELLIYGNGQLQ